MACLSTMNAGPPLCSLGHLERQMVQQGQTATFLYIEYPPGLHFDTLSGREETCCKAKLSYIPYVTFAKAH